MSAFTGFSFFLGGVQRPAHSKTCSPYGNIFQNVVHLTTCARKTKRGEKKEKEKGKKTREEQKQCCKSFITNEILCLWRLGLGRAKLKGGVFMGLMGMVLCLLIFWKCASAIFHSET